MGGTHADSVNVIEMRPSKYSHPVYIFARAPENFPSSKRPDPELSGGHFIVKRDESEIDEAWKIIVKETLEGRLGYECAVESMELFRQFQEGDRNDPQKKPFQVRKLFNITVKFYSFDDNKDAKADRERILNVIKKLLPHKREIKRVNQKPRRIDIENVEIYFMNPRYYTGSNRVCIYRDSAVAENKYIGYFTLEICEEDTYELWKLVVGATKDGRAGSLSDVTTSLHGHGASSQYQIRLFVCNEEEKLAVRSLSQENASLGALKYTQLDE